MKVNKRDTHKRVLGRRITAPATRPDPETGKKILLLSYANANSRQRHDPTTKELFLYAAGSNEEGERPDGLDFLADHQFVVHQDKSGKAIGLDVIPARLYRSRVIPRKQVGIKTLTLQFDLDGAVCKVALRPFNFRPEQTMAIINELDKLIRAGKDIHAGMKLGGQGAVVRTTDNSVEIRPKAMPRQVGGELSAEELAEQAAD